MASHPQSDDSAQSWVRCLFVLGFLVLAACQASSSEPVDAEKRFLGGQYEACIDLCQQELKKPAAARDWWEWKIRAEIALGRLEQALLSCESARSVYPYGLGFSLIQYQLFRETGQEKQTETLRAILDRQILNGAFRDQPAERVAVGRYLFHRGADPKQVLDQFFTAVIKRNPEETEAYFASAELALAKQDRGLASETLAKAPPKARENPQYHYLVARAHAEDDRALSLGAIQEALKRNPRHAPSLLWLAERALEGEDFAAARPVLEKVIAIDPDHPEAWALMAAISHLQGDPEKEKSHRQRALKRWGKNPEVDHLIGKKLSGDYRFFEGSLYQRRSLVFDPTYHPAKLQLCQDLLRLGDEAEGWKLAQEVFAADGYNAVAYNLVQLKDHLGKFEVLAGPGILLKMDPLESKLYGARAMDLLQRARTSLEQKYGWKPTKAVTVEIYPRKNDFAVRTFGLPGAEGFLGVCFGPLITVNSPASRLTAPANWEAVLWHEYCHTVTLHKTRNKMPRWLSEGISVYEETQKDPSWGPWFNPRYREMALGEDFTPLSKLSSAFLTPKSPMHVQFAYFESAMAVEFLIDSFGFPVLESILADLGNDVPINEAIARRTGKSLAQLDQAFAKKVQARAKQIGETLTWEKPGFKETPSLSQCRDFLQKHPNSFWGKVALCQALLKDKQWDKAEAELLDLKSRYPEYVGEGNAYEGLALVYKNRGKPNEEIEVLKQCARRDGDAVGVFRRLIELAREQKTPGLAYDYATKWLAVDPLGPDPHRALATSALATGRLGEAIFAYKTVLAFSPPDAAQIRFQLAKLHKTLGQTDLARKEVLASLEEAPRSIEAHRLLASLAPGPGIHLPPSQNPIKASPTEKPKENRSAPETSPTPGKPSETSQENRKPKGMIP